MVALRGKIALGNAKDAVDGSRIADAELDASFAAEAELLCENRPARQFELSALGVCSQRGRRQDHPCASPRQFENTPAEALGKLKLYLAFRLHQNPELRAFTVPAETHIEVAQSGPLRINMENNTCHQRKSDAEQAAG